MMCPSCDSNASNFSAHDAYMDCSLKVQKDVMCPLLKTNKQWIIHPLVSHVSEFNNNIDCIFLNIFEKIDASFLSFILNLNYSFRVNLFDSFCGWLCLWQIRVKIIIKSQLVDPKTHHLFYQQTINYYQICNIKQYKKQTQTIYYIRQIMGTSSSILNKNKITHAGQNQYISYACTEMQGWRPDMQDESIYKLKIYHPKPNIQNSLFGIFDGHGTNYISIYVRQVFQQTLTTLKQYENEEYETALNICFRKIDQSIISQKGQKRLLQIKEAQDLKSINNKKIPIGDLIGCFCGCTANVVLITQKKLYVANCGDSRSVLCRNNLTIALSKDHKPNDYYQNKRIVEAGGFIKRGRVNDTINVSRAFGDFLLKKNKYLSYQKQLVTCLPDIEIVERQITDQFILMGCDGIWQKCGNKNQILVNYILKTKTFQKKNYAKCLQQVLDHLIAKKPSEQLGQDNMTIILINFKQKI